MLTRSRTSMTLSDGRMFLGLRRMSKLTFPFLGNGFPMFEQVISVRSSFGEQLIDRGCQGKKEYQDLLDHTNRLIRAFYFNVQKIYIN